MIEQDHIVYNDNDVIPDIGSWHRKDKGDMYWGLSTEVDKLPTYDELPMGTLAFCVDTSTPYIYDASAKKWNKM